MSYSSHQRSRQVFRKELAARNDRVSNYSCVKPDVVKPALTPSHQIWTCGTSGTHISAWKQEVSHHVDPCAMLILSLRVKAESFEHAAHVYSIARSCVTLYVAYKKIIFPCISFYSDPNIRGA